MKNRSTVKARFWPWLSGKSFEQRLSRWLFARKQGPRTVVKGVVGVLRIVVRRQLEVLCRFVSIVLHLIQCDQF